jgi:nicotinamidase-related amidase
MKRTMTLALGVHIMVTASSMAAETTSAPAPKIKPALLVIDVQNAFLPYMSEQDKKLGLEMINGAISLFRQSGHPIIRIYHTDPGWGPKPDTEPFEFPKSIAIQPDDPKVVKSFPSAFKKTELETLLREKGVNTLFLTELSATGCVLATYHGALDRDFSAFMVRDTLISPETELTRAVERISETVSFDALRVMLQNASN